MSAGGTYIIKLGLQGDVAGADAVTRALKGSTAAADDFINTIKAGVGIDIGGRIVNQLAQIPGVIEQAIARGVQFNSTIEGTVTAVAAVLEKFQGMSKPDAIIAAGAAVEELKRQAVDAPGTISDIAQAWTASAGAASAANIPINEQIDLMVKLSQAVSRLNLPQQQLVQETRALLTGNITLDAQLAKTLGVTNEMIRAAKEQGNLYGFLVGKIGALGEASDTFEVRLSNFNDVLDQTLGEITEPIFDELRDSILSLTKAIQDPATVRELKALGFEVANLVKGGADLTRWAIENAPALALVAKSAGVLAVALAAIKISQIVVGLSTWALGLNTSKAALDQETAALARNTAGQAANAASRKANAAVPAAQSLPARMLYGDYKSARSGGATAKEATSAAKAATADLALLAASQRKSMIDGQFALARLAKEAETTGGAFGRLRTLLPTGIGTAGQALNGLSLVAITAAIAEGIKSSMQASIDAQTSWANDRLSGYRQLTNRAGKIGSEDERSQLLADIDTALGNAKGNEPLRNGLGELYGRVQSSDLKPRTASPEEVAAADEERRARLEANYKMIESAGDESIAASRDRAADEAIKKALNAGDASLLDSFGKENDERLREATNRASFVDQDTKDLSQAQADQKQYMAIAEELKEARMRIAEEVAEKEKKEAAEVKEKRLQALQDEVKAIEAAGDLRLAKVEESNASEEEKNRQRLAIEDEIAAKRFAVENQIGSLQKESDDARKARQDSYDAAQIMREVQARQQQAQEAESLATGRYDAGEGRINATTGVSAKYGVKGAQYDSFGNLTGGTRGGAPLTTAELGSINSVEGMGGSTLDRFKNSQPGQPGYQPLVTPATLPPAAATPPAAPGAPGAPAAPGQEGGGEGPTAEADKVKEAIGEGVQAVKDVLDEFLKGAGEITKTVTEQGGKIVAEQKATGGEITGKMGEFSTALEQLRQTVANLRS